MVAEVFQESLTKGCFTKNQDFHFLDSVKFLSVIERIKGYLKIFFAIFILLWLKN